MTEAWQGGNVIRARREALKLSQAAVADRVGLNKEVYRRYETGGRELPVTVARRIAEALDLSIAEVAGQIAPTPQSVPQVNSPSAVATLLQTRRSELGLPQTRVAAAAGISVEDYQAYESGAAEIPLTLAAIIAETLDMSLARLAGTEPQGIDLSGTWHARWQMASSPEHAPHTVDALRISNKLVLDQGWRGELDIYGEETLIGWYRPPDRGVRTRMGVLLWLPARGEQLYGRWTGVAENNSVTSGWCALARDSAQADTLLHDLINNSEPKAGPNLRLPRLGGWGSS